MKKGTLKKKTFYFLPWYFLNNPEENAKNNLYKDGRYRKEIKTKRFENWVQL